MLNNNIMCINPNGEKFKEFYKFHNLKNLTYTEVVDKTMLKKMDKIINEIEDEYFKTDYYNFKANYNDKKGLKVKYFNNPIGRRKINKVICSTSMIRELRNILYSNVYDDIDMKNSQVAIFLNLIQNLGYNLNDFPTLNKCYTNKDYFINDIKNSLSTDDDRLIKKALVQVLNLGSHQDIPSLIPLKTEIENLYFKIKDLNIFKKIRNHIKKEKPTFEKGTFMAMVYQSIESKILDIVVENFTQQCIKIGTLEYDGLKIRKSERNNQMLLDKLNQYIYKKTNFLVDFTFKPMIIEEKYQDLLDDVEIDEEEEQLGFYNDYEMGLYLFEKYKNKVYCSLRGDNYIYYFKHNNKWLCNSKKSCLGQFIDRDIKKRKDIYNPETGETETIYQDYTANNNGYNNVLNTFESILQKGDNLISDFHIKLTISNRYSIPFLDGILKINHEKQGQEFGGKYDFIEWCDDENMKKFYPDGYFTRKIVNYNYEDIKNINFEEYTDEENDNSVINKIFKPAFTTTDFDDLDEEKQKEQTTPLDHLLNNYSRMMFGCVSDKKWNLIYGSRNSSKGVITELMLNSFDEFCDTINAGSLCVKDTKGDQAKLLSWIDDKFDCRYLYFNEAKPDLEVDGSLIKLVSGGDRIECRSNHKDEIKRELICVINGNVNDIFKIQPKDTWSNCFLYNLKIRFLTENEKNEDQNELGTPDNYYRLPIENIKTDYCRNKNKCMEFIKLLLEYYDDKLDRTEEMINMVDEEKSEIMESQKEIVLSLIKITGDKKDKIPSTLLKEIMNCYLDDKYKNVKNSIKWRDMLKKNPDIQHNKNVSYPKFEKKSVKSYVGIKFIINDENTGGDYTEKIKDFVHKYYDKNDGDFDKYFNDVIDKKDEIPKKVEMSKKDEIESKCLIESDDDDDEEINNDINKYEEDKMNDLGFSKGKDGKFYKNIDLKKTSKILNFE